MEHAKILPWKTLGILWLPAARREFAWQKSLHFCTFGICQRFACRYFPFTCSLWFPAAVTFRGWWWFKTRNEKQRANIQPAFQRQGPFSKEKSDEKETFKLTTPLPRIWAPSLSFFTMSLTGALRHWSFVLPRILGKWHFQRQRSVLKDGEQ